MRRSPKGSPGAVLDLQRRVDQAVSADHAELMTIAKDANTFFGAESVQDPYPLYERMRAAGSVHRIANSDFYAVCGWDAVNEAIGRPEDFSSNLTATMTYTAEGTAKPFEMDPLGGPTHVLATADDPAHAVHRKLVLRHLAAKRIRVMEQFTVQAADRLWVDGMQDGCIEWMGAMANRLPMMVVAELIGLPDPDIAQLVKWGYAATQLLEGLVENDQLVAAGVALMELSGYIFEQFDRAAADPRDNLLGELATACASGELDTLTAQVMMVT
ncbi:cytochrome P450, partial [Mycobacterium tuberculosis]